MAIESNMKNMALCLTAVCLLCSSLLGGVYAMTSEPIADAASKAVKTAVAQVLPEGVQIGPEKTITVGGTPVTYFEASKDGEVVAYAVKSSSNGFGGELKVMAGVLCDGTVYNVKVLSHAETPGLGAKCTQEEFLKQFRGFAPDRKLYVRKDGGEIDAITASTITSRAFCTALQNAKDVVTEIMK